MKRIILLFILGVAVRQAAQAQTNLPPVKTAEAAGVAGRGAAALPMKGGGQGHVQALSEGSRKVSSAGVMGSAAADRPVAPMKTGGGSAEKAVLQIKSGGSGGATTGGVANAAVGGANSAVTGNGKTATGGANAANGAAANSTAANGTAGKAPLRTSDGGAGGGKSGTSTAAAGGTGKTATATSTTGAIVNGKEVKLASSEPAKKPNAGQTQQN